MPHTDDEDSRVHASPFSSWTLSDNSRGTAPTHTVVLNGDNNNSTADSDIDEDIDLATAATRFDFAATPGFHTILGSTEDRPTSDATLSVSSRDSASDSRMSSNPYFDITETLLSGTPTYTPDTSPSSLEAPGTTPAAGTREAARQVNMASKMDGTLPANDGMDSLRQKMHEIRQLAVSTEEKAQRMHFLMTRDFLAMQATNGPPEPDKLAVPEPSKTAPPIDPVNPFNLRLHDLEPSFSPVPLTLDEDTEADESVDEETRPPMLGCVHYTRNVKVQCFDCHRWYPCRHCHDSAPDLPFEHILNRKKTQHMLCMLCQTPQPASEMCINCGEFSAWYYCSKCKLWDNDSNKSIYHCDDCGICRRGEGLGKDFVHCKRCNVCISISTEASHPCVERATEGDCPLCLVNLFHSQTNVVSMPCGHYMHAACYKDLMAVTYRCPVCSKSAVNMELQWRKLDDEIRAQPMPENDEELSNILPHIEPPPDTEPTEPSSDGTAQTLPPARPRTVWAGCNDCGGRSETPFHWLGLKCQVCGGYNTNQVAPIDGRETKAERLIRQQQHQHHRHHDFAGTAVLRDAGIGMPDAEERADSAYSVPLSPAQVPAPATAPHSPTSPGRRYFVQEESRRRPSFNASNFRAPSMPNLPQLPTLRDLPNLPNLEHMRENMRQNFPNMPNMPHMPNMPNLELSRFNPYEMVQALSRSLSPMRYYLEGLDVRDEDMQEQRLRQRWRAADANLSPRSAASAPAAPGRALGDPFSGGEGEGRDEDDMESLLLEDDEDEDEGEEGSSSGEDSEESDADDFDNEGADEDESERKGKRGFDMEFFGHR